MITRYQLLSQAIEVDIDDLALTVAAIERHWQWQSVRGELQAFAHFLTALAGSSET